MSKFSSICKSLGWSKFFFALSQMESGELFSGVMANIASKISISYIIAYGGFWKLRRLWMS